MASSSYRGLPGLTTQGGKPALITRITRLQVHYTVKWPLNVIVSDEQIHTYQQAFAVLLQVCATMPCHAMRCNAMHEAALCVLPAPPRNRVVLLVCSSSFAATHTFRYTKLKC
jgi:hypothetical protein